jgi:tungstate transport system permease protein
MQTIFQALTDALQMLTSLDSTLYGIIFRSLTVSLSATLLATIVAVPVGIWLSLNEFPGKKIAIRLLYTLMSLPPVVAGLFIFLLLARRGPLGGLQLSFTITAMIIVQFILVTPIIAGIIYSSNRTECRKTLDLARTLGARGMEIMVLIFTELKIPILCAVAAGFGRAISEVGAVMIVGGNIQGSTRVMTTAIAMTQSMGEYDLALANGLILLFLSFMINSFLFHYQSR